MTNSLSSAELERPERSELLGGEQFLDPGRQAELATLGWREDGRQAPEPRGMSVVGQDVGQLFDEGFGAGLRQAEAAALGLGPYQVDPGLGQPPEVGEVGLQFGAGLALGPQLGKRKTSQIGQVAGVKGFVDVERHRSRGYRNHPTQEVGRRPRRPRPTRWYRLRETR